jgi:SAM-dependent methyltransferase
MKSALRRKPARAPSLVPHLKEHSQLWLDVGCGEAKQQNCVGMDRRALPGVDYVHDLEVVPWPFEAGTFSRIVMSHVMEHIKPWLVIDVMNEMWRVMKVDGVLLMAMPYPGSHGHWQDPTHIKPWNETTPRYFDPDCPELYEIYKPSPWKIEGCAWRSDGNIEIVLRKRKAK